MLAVTPRVGFLKSAPLGFSRVPLTRKAAVLVKAAESNHVNVKTAFESFVKPVSLTAISSLVLALPAHADAGKLFDFNLTLPVMAIQFLILMVALTGWFSSGVFWTVGNLLDERDKLIRDQLANVSSNNDEIERLEREAEEILKKARTDAQAAVNKARMENDAKAAAIYEEEKAKSDAEIAEAFANFEKERDAAIKSLEPQVDELAKQIVVSILPDGVLA